MNVHTLTFNEFAENTYVLSDDTGECAIIDPGCATPSEKEKLQNFISEHNLKPVQLLNTHCHIDHVFGVPFVEKTYGLRMQIHQGEMVVLQFVPQVAQMYGLHVETIDQPTSFLREGDVVRFGETELKVLFTPGHSPASVCFYHEESKQVIAGDVLFQGSIGRTDLPGGDYDKLMGSITDELLPLGDDVRVYPGHGPATTIGIERRMNPFLVGVS